MSSIVRERAVCQKISKEMVGGGDSVRTTSSRLCDFGLWSTARHGI